MLLNDIPPWLLSVLCIAGLVAGVALHLAWHPLRRHFSDALDFMRTHDLPLWLAMAGLATAEVVRRHFAVPAQEVLRPMWSSHEELVSPAKQALEGAAMLFHQWFPPWPLSLVFPVLLVILAMKVMRFPYRYQKRKSGLEQIALLVLLAVGGIAWTAIEIFTFGSQRAGLAQTMLAGARAGYGLVSIAGLQTWLARLVIVWDEPDAGWTEEDKRTALDQCVARWQNILWLSFFNLSWFSLLSVSRASGEWLPWLVFIEFLVLFSALPMAVAAGKGSFMHCGGQALRAFALCAVPLLGHLITAAALLLMTQISITSISALSAAMEWGTWPVEIAEVLLLALLRTWLLVAGLLILHRGAFAASRSGQ